MCRGAARPKFRERLMNRIALIVFGSALNAQSCKHSQTISTTAHAEEKKDIIETAVGAGQFKTLAAALKAAGLIEALKGDGPFTVFSPTDDAFKALPAGTVEDLLKPENKDKLTAILTYHVVALEG